MTMYIIAAVVIAAAVVYVLVPSGNRRNPIEAIPPGQGHRFVTLERLIEDHLDFEDEREEMRRKDAVRAAKRRRAKEAVKRLAGDGAADASPGAASPN